MNALLFDFSYLALWRDYVPQLLLSKVKGFLFFIYGQGADIVVWNMLHLPQRPRPLYCQLVAAGFLLIALTACSGGGGGSDGNGPMDADPGDNRSMNNGSMVGAPDGNGSMVGDPSINGLDGSGGNA